jgi:cytoskeleton protein RodZ
MKLPVTEALPENIEVVTPGLMLKEARISLQLTTLDIAKKLNLRDSLIQSIENSEFEDIPSNTFARGYLKAYAKLVSVNEIEVLEAFEYLSTVEKQQLEMQSFSHGSSRKTLDNRLTIFSFLVVAVIIVLAVVWWFQRNAEPLSIIDNEVTAQTSTSSQDVVIPVKIEQQIPVITEPENKQSEVASGEESSGSVVDAANAAQTEADVPDLPETTSEELDRQIAEQLQDSNTDINADLAHLELRFSGSCWINISDASGERVAIGTKTKGHLTSVYGTAPFTIKLGKPDVVSIWLDGKQKEIPYYPKGSIANFELSSD